MKFETGFSYHDRPSKAEYVWKKYRLILEGRTILDVGADECHLKQYLDPGARYTGIGLGGNPDLQVNLEKEKIPFEARSFDTVVCLDVLEHLDNTHAVFDELCRVSKHHVIISLPNPWADFWGMMRKKEYAPGRPMKFYGLPPEPPEDRHKWFFSAAEAEAYIRHRAAKNGMTVIAHDCGGVENYFDRLPLLDRLAMKRLFRRDFNFRDIFIGPSWTVLEREVQSSA